LEEGEYGFRAAMVWWKEIKRPPPSCPRETNQKEEEERPGGGWPRLPATPLSFHFYYIKCNRQEKLCDLITFPLSAPFFPFSTRTVHIYK
jgi:hypothetical protein